MDKRYQVFVSSTYADLKEERQKVMHALMQMDCIPTGMELFPAADEEQLQFIKRIIDDCDYYLLIIGGRYGSVTDEGISYTEKEYEYALERKIKVVAFLHKNPEQISFDKSEKTPELQEKLKNFRDKLASGRLVKYWQSIEELPGLVALSLMNTIKLSPAVGWVRADKVSSEELLTEINELRKKNEQLQKALSEIEPSIFTASEETDFAYIHKQLCRSEIIHVECFGFVNDSSSKKTAFNINLASLVVLLPTTETIYAQRWNSVPTSIIQKLSSFIPNEHMVCSITMGDKLADELLMYGFLTKNHIPAPPPPEPFNRNPAMLLNWYELRGTNKLVYSEKLERYKYWLKVTNKMPECIQLYVKEE